METRCREKGKNVVKKCTQLQKYMRFLSQQSEKHDATSCSSLADRSTPP